MNNLEGNRNRIFSIITILVLIIAGLFSFFVISDVVSSPDFNAKTIASLDEKEDTVLKLAAAAAASSTALTLIPGDVAEPIANQIADLTKYFLIILAAIVLEKMLISITGYLVFTFIIPLVCLLVIAYQLTQIKSLLQYAIKFTILGGVLFIAIPASVHISDLIDESYQASITQTLEHVEENNVFIDDKKNDLSKMNQSWLSQIESYVIDFTTKIGADLKAIVEKGENSLSSFLEAIAVLIVTSCIIPILVLLCFVWVIKFLFGINMGESIQRFSSIDPKS